jgi:hypothetical protein
MTYLHFGFRLPGIRRRQPLSIGYVYATFADINSTVHAAGPQLNARRPHDIAE